MPQHITTRGASAPADSQNGKTQSRSSKKLVQRSPVTATIPGFINAVTVPKGVKPLKDGTQPLSVRIGVIVEVYDDETRAYENYQLLCFDKVLLGFLGEKMRDLQAFADKPLNERPRPYPVWATARGVRNKPYSKDGKLGINSEGILEDIRFRAPEASSRPRNGNGNGNGNSNKGSNGS